MYRVVTELQPEITYTKLGEILSRDFFRYASGQTERQTDRHALIAIL